MVYTWKVRMDVKSDWHYYPVDFFVYCYC